jgi:large subunit ribosomal protein L9
VFLDDVEGVARAGDIKNVADGYARNFLLPRKLAAAATTSTMQQAEKRAKQLAKEQEKLDEAAQAVATKLGRSAVVIAAKVGEQGRLFGSVTATDIAEALNASAGSNLEHRQVALPTPIKEVGTYEVAVSLTRNVKAQVMVQVKGEGEEEAPKASSKAKAAQAADAEDEEDEDDG